MRSPQHNAAPRRAEPSEPNDDTDLVRQYLNQISADLLTAEQEVELAKRIEAGVYAAHLLDEAEQRLSAQRRADLQKVARDGQRAKDRIIRANLRLVVSAARKHVRRGIPFLDVIQDGNLGLIRAVEKFDYQRGYKFSTYAMWWIRQFIDRGADEQSRAVRLPSQVAQDLARVGRVERQLEFQLHDAPSTEQVAEQAGFPVERVEELRRLGRGVVSLDTPIGDDEGDTRLGDLIEDPAQVQAADLAEFRAFAAELRALVDTLPPREAMIICLRYGLHDGRPRTLAEVAQHIGLTKERIRQLEKEAMTKLRDPERNQVLLSWAS